MLGGLTERNTFDPSPQAVEPPDRRENTEIRSPNYVESPPSYTWVIRLTLTYDPPALAQPNINQTLVRGGGLRLGSAESRAW